MPRLVISYRRSHDRAIAHRIFERLCSRYGDSSVFIDVVSNRAGISFREQINQALRSCDALVVIVGPKWRELGKRALNKLSDDSDPIRIEIETALQLGIRIVPILVDNAEMPGKDEIPKNLARFVELHAPNVDSGVDFDHHMNRVLKQLDDLLGFQGKWSVLLQRAALAFKVTNTVTKTIFALPSVKFGGAAAGLLATLSYGLFSFGSHTTERRTTETPKTMSSIPVPKPSAGGIDWRVLIMPHETSSRPLRSIVFAPNGTRLAIGGDDGLIRLWNTDTFSLERRFFGHKGSIRKVGFSRDGEKLISAGFDKTVRIWDVATGKQIGNPLVPAEDFAGEGFYSLAVLQQSPLRYIMAGGSDGKIRIWDLSHHPTLPVRTFPAYELAAGSAELKEVFSLSYSPNSSGDYAVSGRDKNIKISTTSDITPKILNSKTSSVFFVKFSNTGESLISAGREGLLQVWDVHRGERSMTYSGATKAVLTAEWSHDGKLLAAAGEDRKVRLWSAANPEPIHTFDQHKKDVETVAFHPNRKWLFSASEDGTLKAWDLQTFNKEPVFTAAFFRKDETGDDYVVYSSNGRFTGSPGLNEYVRFFYVEQGVEKLLDNTEKMKLFTPPEMFASFLKE